MLLFAAPVGEAFFKDLKAEISLQIGADTKEFFAGFDQIKRQQSPGEPGFLLRVHLGQ